MKEKIEAMTNKKKQSATHQCVYCGKFVSASSNGIRMISGSPEDCEPDEYYHVKCEKKNILKYRA